MSKAWKAQETKTAREYIQPWWKVGEFARTPNSGGMRSRFGGTLINTSDIRAEDKFFPLALECKFEERSKWNLDGIFKQGWDHFSLNASHVAKRGKQKGELVKTGYFYQCAVAALYQTKRRDDAGLIFPKIPVVVAGRNRWPRFAFAPRYLWDLFGQPEPVTPYITIPARWGLEIRVGRLEDILDSLDADEIRKQYRKAVLDRNALFTALLSKLRQWNVALRFQEDQEE